MKKVVIWGASGHARVVADILRAAGGAEVFCFLDDTDPTRWGTPFCGQSIVGGKEALAKLREADVRHGLVAVGDCAARLRLAQELRAAGFDLVIAIHPSAVVAADARIGSGTVIAAGAVVGAGATVGENVILNTCSSVDHDCVIQDGSHICPGVHLAGRVRVGLGSWIGIGSTVIGKVEIGRHTVVGAGSLVLKSLPEGVVAYGVPARVVRCVSAQIAGSA